MIKNLSEKSLSLVVIGVSIAVFLVVSILMAFPQVFSSGALDVRYLPGFHAAINGTCTLLLLLGFVFIKQKNIAAHKIAMVTCFALSTVFLISYVIYHSHAPSTKFGGVGFIRYIYYFVLLTHIVLAAAILPLALFTISRAWRGEFEKHKRIARITLPLWIYVTSTGVLVYFMISPYYRF